MRPGSWQSSLSGWRLALLVVWIEYLAQLVCRVRGCRPERYSLLTAFHGITLCARCRREVG